MFEIIIAVVLFFVVYSIGYIAAKGLAPLKFKMTYKETYRDENYIYYNCYPAFSKEEA